MKSIFTCLLVIVILTGCRKDFSISGDPYLSALQENLNDSISRAAYEVLDFERTVRTETDVEDLFYLRVPRKGIPLNKSFLLLKTSGSGKLLGGRWIDITKEAGTSPGIYNRYIQIRA